MARRTPVEDARELYGWQSIEVASLTASMPTRLRAAAFLCIGIALFAAFMPAVCGLDSAVLPPLLSLLPPVPSESVSRWVPTRCDEQPLAFFSPAFSRPPPAFPSSV